MGAASAQVHCLITADVEHAAGEVREKLLEHFADQRNAARIAGAVDYEFILYALLRQYDTNFAAKGTGRTCNQLHFVALFLEEYDFRTTYMYLPPAHTRRSPVM